jgi:multidrug efflux pump subunit AcrB
MSGFNLSALAVRERAVTLFALVALVIAGALAFLNLGRAEDPIFTVKVLTMTAAWPGATAQEMQDLVAEPLEKRLQELEYYDRVESFTRPGLAFLTLTLKDSAPAEAVPDQFYQARKKLGDEASRLPKGALGPFFNDEYSDTDFALYAVKAKGMPLRELARHAETLRQRMLHVPGIKKIDLIGERPERIFVDFSFAKLTRRPKYVDRFERLLTMGVRTPWVELSPEGAMAERKYQSTTGVVISVGKSKMRKKNCTGLEGAGFRQIDENIFGRHAG